MKNLFDNTCKFWEEREVGIVKETDLPLIHTKYTEPEPISKDYCVSTGFPEVLPARLPFDQVIELNPFGYHPQLWKPGVASFITLYWNIIQYCTHLFMIFTIMITSHGR